MLKIGGNKKNKQERKREREKKWIMTTSDDWAAIRGQDTGVQCKAENIAVVIFVIIFACLGRISILPSLAGPFFFQPSDSLSLEECLSRTAVSLFCVDFFLFPFFLFNSSSRLTSEIVDKRGEECEN